MIYLYLSWIWLLLLFCDVHVAAGQAPTSSCAVDPFYLIPFANYSGPYPCGEAGAPPCVDLAGKVALVTGASTGIGRKLAERLTAGGVQVVGTSRWPWRYQAPGSFALWQMDQVDSESVKALVDRVNCTYGRIDLLCLNAGRDFTGDVANSDLRQMQAVFETNFWGPIRVLQAALPLLPTSGYARVLVTSSVQSQMTLPFYTIYSATKRALQALQEGFLLEHAKSTHLQLITLMPHQTATCIGYKAIWGCPERGLSQEAEEFARSFASPDTLPAEDAAESLFRIAVNPAPELRYVVGRDWQMAQYAQQQSARLSQPMSMWIKTAATQSGVSGDCSVHCGGKEFCGAGPLGAGAAGTGSIVAY